MSVKCWNCGAENSNTDEYCLACASTLVPYQKDERLNVLSGNTLRVLSEAMEREAGGALMLSILLIFAVAAITLIYDLLTGSAAVTELGTLLFFTGLAIIAIFSFTNIRTPQKTGVLSRSRVVHAHPAFWPSWMSAQGRPFPDRYSQQLMPLLVGVIVLLAGVLVSLL